jgi:DNA-binding beta-propeller fold protein YncE
MLGTVKYLLLVLATLGVVLAAVPHAALSYDAVTFCSVSATAGATPSPLGYTSVLVDQIPVAVAVNPVTSQALIADRRTNVVSVVDIRTGAILRAIQGGRDACSVGWDTSSGTGFVVFGDDNVVGVLDPRTGTARHLITVGQDPSAVLVDARTQRAFVVNSYIKSRRTGTVSVLDARSGTVLRTVAVGQDPSPAAIDESMNRLFVLNTAIRGHARGSVNALDARTGAVLRTIAVGLAPSAVAIDAHTGRVFVLNSNVTVTHNDVRSIGRGTVSVLDARTGAVLRTVIVGSVPSAVTVDAHTGRVFVLNSNVTVTHNDVRSIGRGTVSVLDARTGMMLRTIAVGTNPSAIVVDEKTGQVLVTNSGEAGNNFSGSLNVLDAGTGTVRHTIRLGQDPSAMAVDERSGRLLLVTMAITVARGTISNIGQNSVVVLDVATLEPLRVIPLPQAVLRPSPTARPSSTTTPLPTATPSYTATPSITVTSTFTATPLPTATPTLTATPSFTVIPSATATPTSMARPSPTATATSSPTPTRIPGGP